MSDNDKIEKQGPSEEIIIPVEKREIILNIIKMEHYKISKLLSDSTVSKKKKKKWVEVND